MYSGIWDGFDTYDSTHELWDAVNGTFSYSSAFARFAAAPNCVSKGIKFTSGGGGANWKRKNFTANEQTVILGFAIYMPVLATSLIITLLDVGNYQSSFAVTAAGQLALYQSGGSSPTLLASSAAGLITANVWAWLDLVFVIGAIGRLDAYLNQPRGGSPTFTAFGNTKTTGNSYANVVQIGDTSGVLGGLQMDDFHCHSASGNAPNIVLGAGTRIYSKMPSGPGALSNWTPIGAPSGWDAVNDAPTPDEDTTYVLAGSSLEDNYAVGPAGMGTSNIANGIVRRSRIRTDTGAPTFQNGIRSNGIDQLAAAVSVPSSYGYTDSCSIIDPNTGLPWSVAAADLATPIIYRTT
jgi:hypothetical protein